MSQKYMAVEVERGDCIEVFATGWMAEGLKDGALLGYAVRFGGTWDAWAVSKVSPTLMHRHGTNLVTSQEAIQVIVGEDSP